MGNVTWLSITPKECLLLQHLALFSGSFYFKDVISSYAAIEGSANKLFDLLYNLFTNGFVSIARSSQQLGERMYQLTNKAAIALVHCRHVLARLQP